MESFHWRRVQVENPRWEEEDAEKSSERVENLMKRDSSLEVSPFERQLIDEPYLWRHPHTHGKNGTSPGEEGTRENCLPGLEAFLFWESRTSLRSPLLWMGFRLCWLPHRMNLLPSWHPQDQQRGVCRTHWKGSFISITRLMYICFLASQRKNLKLVILSLWKGRGAIATRLHLH